MKPFGMSFNDLEHISLSKITDVDACINWIDKSLFGSSGAKWAKNHVRMNKITNTEQLLRDLALLWPNSVFVNEILSFEVTKNYISTDFIKSIPKDRIIECAYHLALGRPPDKPGLMHYNQKIQEAKDYSKIIDNIVSSEEAISFAKRKVITKNQLKLLQNEAMMRGSMVFFRQPKSTFSNFFEKRNTSVANNETKSEWYFVYKDLSRNITVLSAGVNLIGESYHDGYLKCGSDWILYGPKIPLPAGKYTIYAEIDAPPYFKYHLDASYGGGIYRVCEMNLSGNLNIALSFEIFINIEEFEIRLLNLTSINEIINIKRISIKSE